MKVILPLLFTVFVFADDGSPEDRQAIERTIVRLNLWLLWDMPAITKPPSSIFTADAISDLDKMPRPKTLSVRQSADPASIDGDWHPVVTVSEQPWGEAQINLPGFDPNRKVEFLNPRISVTRVRFLTPEVALADGTWTAQEGEAKHTVPLLFVMKKEHDGWKIAVARRLAR